jgi:hypothetical protein
MMRVKHFIPPKQSNSFNEGYPSAAIRVQLFPQAAGKYSNKKKGKLFS